VLTITESVLTPTIVPLTTRGGQRSLMLTLRLCPMSDENSSEVSGRRERGKWSNAMPEGSAFAGAVDRVAGSPAVVVCAEQR